MLWSVAPPGLGRNFRPVSGGPTTGTASTDSSCRRGAPSHSRQRKEIGMLSKWKTALHALLRKSEMERELDEELRHHIEQQTEQNIRLGMSPEEARQAALKSFGGVEQAKEQSRDAHGMRWPEDLW